MTVVDVGPYQFRIIDSGLKDDSFFVRSFKIGGNYSDCVNVSIGYEEGQPMNNAKIPTLVWHPDCSITTKLPRGEGTILMIKTLLRHIHHNIPEVTLFKFEDKSNIECGTEAEQHQKRRRKEGTNAYPVVLYYFSLVFNGITWYEKNFNAYQMEGHERYREFVKTWLNAPKPSFEVFRRKAMLTEDIQQELLTYYERADNYGMFFQSIPRDNRCRLVRSWLYHFMEEEFNTVFSNKGWIIDVTKMDEPSMQGGKYKVRGKRYTRKKNPYYSPNGIIRFTDTISSGGSM